MHNHLFQKVTPKEKVETIEFLDKQQYQTKKPPKRKIMKCMGLNPSTYYEIKAHVPSASEIKRDAIKDQIFEVYHEFKGVYGSPKITAVLKQRNVVVSVRSVSIYMKQLGLKSITVPDFKTPKTIEAQLSFGIPMMNYIKENRPVKAHTHILTDITYIYTTTAGWTYLVTFMDMYTRKILAWDLSTTMTAAWVCGVASELIDSYETIEYVHSDQGTQYTSKQYLTLLLENGISPSFSSQGYPYHNAWIESFHAQLKKEYIYRRVLRCPDEAKQACFLYIEGFYNTIRIQKKLGYLSPNDYEVNVGKAM